MGEKLTSVADKTKRMTELVKQLNHASSAYYGGKAEVMSDHEWDALFDELKELERETGITLKDSPTNNVSSESSEENDGVSGVKEAHEYPALSLAKTKNVHDLVKWSENRPIWVSWKLDGLTLVVTYDEGKLTKVVTRGNGHIGTNITHLASAIKGIPTTIVHEGHLVIRGECVISYDDFKHYIAETNSDYANPRNLASGSLNVKDVNDIKSRGLKFIAFGVVYTESFLPESKYIGWGEYLDWLNALGFSTVERVFIKAPCYDAINDVIDDFTAKVDSGENNIPVDGLVICYDDVKYARSGNVTGHHAVRGGLAFKWKDESVATTLREIEWSCGTTCITPVAVFDPVDIEGTTVSRASLCNISECERLNIGEEGTTIEVIKANKIIPKVISVTKKVGELIIPKRCPACGSIVKVEVSDASGTKVLHCLNDLCPAKQLKKFSRFVSKEGMNIEGLSEQTLERFIDMGWIRDFADIYDMCESFGDELIELDGFGLRSAAKLYDSIENSRTVDVVHFLYALSIPQCGLDVCKKLTNAYTSLNGLVGVCLGDQDASEVLSHVSGIGPEKSEAFVSWFRDKNNLELYKKLISRINITEMVSANSEGGKCNGATFVITGNVHHYKNRNELKAYIESEGGKVASAVSNSTTYLINNDIESVSGKNKRAKELGVTIISEDEFIERYG